MTIELLEKIEKDWILILTDVSDNVKRNFMRRKLIEYFTAKQMTQSCYIIPACVALKDDIKRWGEDHSFDIRVIGMSAELVDAKTLTQEYTQELKMRLEEIDEQAEYIWKELLEKEENMDDSKKSSIAGFHSKVKSIRSMFDDIQKTINKYGNENDVFSLQKLVVFVRDIENRYSRFVELKKRQKDERELGF